MIKSILVEYILQPEDILQPVVAELPCRRFSFHLLDYLSVKVPYGNLDGLVSGPIHVRTSTSVQAIPIK